MLSELDFPSAWLSFGSLVRLDVMKSSHTMRDIFGFATLAVIGIIGLWLLRLVFANPVAFIVLFVPSVIAWSLLAVGILGMIWVIVEKLVSSVIARRRGKASAQRNSCQKESA